MKFYIFANEKDGAFTTSVADAIYSSLDYMATRTQFDIINKEFKYRNSYLVADLNVVEFKQGMFTRPVSINRDDILNNKYLPYFIIGEFHYNDLVDSYVDPSTGRFDPNKTIRNDAVSIKLPGFTQQFYNNQSALLSYLYFIDNSYYATLEIKMIVNNPNRKEAIELDRLLGVSIESKQKMHHQGFNRLELPAKVVDCYLPAMFETRPAPRLYDLRESKEDSSKTNIMRSAKKQQKDISVIIG